MTIRKIRCQIGWTVVTIRRSLSLLDKKETPRFIKINRTLLGIVSKLVWKVEKSLGRM